MLSWWSGSCSCHCSVVGDCRLSLPVALNYPPPVDAGRCMDFPRQLEGNIRLACLPWAQALRAAAPPEPQGLSLRVPVPLLALRPHGDRQRLAGNGERAAQVWPHPAAVPGGVRAAQPPGHPHRCGERCIVGRGVEDCRVPGVGPGPASDATPCPRARSDGTRPPPSSLSTPCTYSGHQVAGHAEVGQGVSGREVGRAQRARRGCAHVVRGVLRLRRRPE